ncbi:hypothetical protein [Microbacterium sp. H83]|uniref:hypothetical protein n=1 Tax=Microbacterium sp. H83 TaxID=1827324 RepID=UPI0007F542B1|nr:hypothetical protein [Microbacterium sp. H83]OAN36645.1 hypothetical protein A4X16_04420 [Microbacterium sp. H83]
MTSPHTLPIPQHVAPAHEHSWVAESRHPTSDGVIVYVRCAACGTRRVDLQARTAMPPAALSAEIVG